MLIGRGEDYAWSLTSAGLDIVDNYAETLCGGSRQKYQYKGKCVKMDKVDAGVLSKDGKKTRVVFYRTVHGPVIGYANRANGTQTVAIARKRSSYGQDVVDQLFFQQLTFGRVKSFEDFRKAAELTPQTFNSFYADDKHIGFFTTGKLPLRKTGSSGDLPIDGRGSYEWTGFLKNSAHPQAKDPKSGLIVNWNNKPVKGFAAGDDRFGAEGPIQRVQLLTDNLAKTQKHTLATVTGAMNAAASQDIRGEALWPTLKKVLAKGTAPSARERRMVELLDQWSVDGASRLDRSGDGKIDDPGVAIMDAAFPLMAKAAMCAPLGKGLCDRLAKRVSIFDQPPSGQYGGWHQYMQKDLRTLLGTSVKRKYTTAYCGKGKVSTCASALWGAIKQAGDTLEKAQGPDPAVWLKDEAPERISFTPLLLIPMNYTNRPSGIQQVISFDGHR
jgi:hypothetical protein